MDYEKFVEEIRKMLSEYSGNKLLVPTLGGKSLFLVCISEGKLKIVNKECMPYSFKADEYEAIKQRFVESPVFASLKTCNYTNTKGSSARCIGWCAENGNRNEIYWGYLPAVFRELYARKGVCMGNTPNYQSADMRSYVPTDWNAFVRTVDVCKILESISYNSYKFNITVSAQTFASAKNEVLKLLTGGTWHAICNLWSDALCTIGDEVLRYVILLIMEEMREIIVDKLKEWRTQRKINKYPRRNCNNCDKASK